VLAVPVPARSRTGAYHSRPHAAWPTSTDRCTAASARAGVRAATGEAASPRSGPGTSTRPEPARGATADSPDASASAGTAPAAEALP